MIRTFKTHDIRRQQELSNTLWEFTPLEGEHVGKHYQVSVPSCWESYPDFSSYRGEAIYKTTFTGGGNIRLEFKGVSHTATVYLDGEEVTSHYNAYTIFDRVLKDVPYKEHILEVKVDNRFSEDSALHIQNDYYSYGGITRPVALEFLNEVYIKWVHFTPSFKDGKWFGNIEACIENLSDNSNTVRLVSTLKDQTFDLGVHKLLGLEEAKISKTFEFNDVKPWSPETPNLYLLKTVLYNYGEAMDDTIERIGFREVRIEGKQILLNNRPLLIKGFCRHEDHPHFGCAIPYSAMEYDLNLMMDLGANSVRTSHYPNDEIFLDLCDEKGILVWEENHARGLSEEDMRNPNFQKQCDDCIREMITTHYNHPSIYIWGILNECASETEYGKSCYEKQYAQIKDLDSSRPRSSASCKFKTDLCFGYPEVVSYNIYPKWYHDTPVIEYINDLYNWVQEETEGKEKPFLITEIGAGAIYGYRTHTQAKWSEEYQAKALQEQINSVLSQEGCSGIYIWQFCDVRVTEDWFNNRPRTMNNKGVVDEYRRRKLSYDVVKEIYRTKPNYWEN